MGVGVQSDQLITLLLWFTWRSSFTSEGSHTRAVFSRPRALASPLRGWGEGGVGAALSSESSGAGEKGCLFVLRNGVESSGEGRRRRDICFFLSGYNESLPPHCSANQKKLICGAGRVCDLHKPASQPPQWARLLPSGTWWRVGHPATRLLELTVNLSCFC